MTCARSIALLLYRYLVMLGVHAPVFTEAGQAILQTNLQPGSIQCGSSVSLALRRARHLVVRHERVLCSPSRQAVTRVRYVPWSFWVARAVRSLLAAAVLRLDLVNGQAVREDARADLEVVLHGWAGEGKAGGNQNSVPAMGQSHGRGADNA